MNNSNFFSALIGILIVLGMGLGVFSLNTYQQLQLAQQEVTKLEKRLEEIKSDNKSLQQQFDNKQLKINQLQGDIGDIDRTYKQELENVKVLKTCLGGVLTAIDYSSAGDEEQAVTSLLFVLDSCREASLLYE